MPAEQGYDVTAAADRNFIGSYRKLVDHSPSGTMRAFGAVTAFTTGLPFGLFNGCIVVEQADPADLDAALDWIAGLDVPYRVWIREEFGSGLRHVSLRRGMEEEERLFPAMILEPVPDPPGLPLDVSVRRVDGPVDLEEHRAVHIQSGMTADMVRRMFPDSLAEDPEVRLFTAYLDKRPVGTSLAIRTGDVSGVYAVGTLPEARGRGVGTAATWAAVAAGKAWGCTAIALQSTEIGLSVYRRMGFRTVVRYLTFARPTG
jgi:GNAT superfamily N-acetyltransferase